MLCTDRPDETLPAELMKEIREFFDTSIVSICRARESSIGSIFVIALSGILLPSLVADRRAQKNYLRNFPTLT